MRRLAVDRCANKQRNPRSIATCSYPWQAQVPMAVHVFLIHGVGPFDREHTETELREGLDGAGVWLRDVFSYDWCEVAGDPFRNLPEVGKAMLRLAHTATHSILFADVAFLSAQLCALFFVPVVFLSLIRKSLTPLLIWIICLSLLLGIGWVAELLSGNAGVVRRCRRRTVFCIAWPILHAIAAPAFLRPWRAAILLLQLPF